MGWRHKYVCEDCEREANHVIKPSLLLCDEHFLTEINSTLREHSYVEYFRVERRLPMEENSFVAWAIFRPEKEEEE